MTSVFALTAAAQSADDFKGVIGPTDKESRTSYPSPVLPKPGSPNVIYIVLDDVGFSDIGAFGSEINTPNLDWLAANGLRYDNYHTRAICSATRAALLTGRNSHSVGVETVTNFVDGFPHAIGHVTHAAATVGEILQAGGYNTFAVGKWHLVQSKDMSAAGPFDQWPVQRGFNRYYGFLDAMTDQIHPELVRDNTPIDPPRTPDYYLSTDLTDQSIDDIRDTISVEPQRPFLLYLAYGAQHAPHQAPRTLIDKYMPIFEKGWDKTRDDRLTREKALGLVPQNTVLPQRNPGIKAWDDLTPVQKKVFVRMQAAYAAMLEQADGQIGRLLDFLRKTDQISNTLIIVSSDNGASQEGQYEGKLSELEPEPGRTSLKTTVTGGPPPEEIRKRIDTEYLARYDDIGTDKAFENYPMGWAMAGNTPFRFYKQTIWAGGERDPLIVTWPKVITDKGAIRHQFVDVIDITPTVVGAAGMTAPKVYHDVAQKPLEGASFAATFTNSDAPDARHTQYFELAGQRAIWHDGWKAIATHKMGTDFSQDTWQLFDAPHDFSETQDVSAKYPERLCGLQNQWVTEAQKYGVLPLNGRPLGEIMAEAWAHEDNPQTVYTFYPGQQRLPREAVPQIVNRSFSVTAYSSLPNGGTEGVLFKDGDRFGGYVLYIKGGKLYFDYNDFGKHTVLSSASTVPTGPATLKFDFTRTGKNTGDGTLSINGHTEATARISSSLGATWFSWTGIEVGRDTLGPVTDAYVDRGIFQIPRTAFTKVVLRYGPRIPLPIDQTTAVTAQHRDPYSLGCSRPS